MQGAELQDLAKAHGVGFAALRSRAQREKWAELRASRPENAIMDTADLLLKKLRTTLEADEEPQSQSLRQYTATLKDLMRIRGVRHEADIREQEARIEKLRRDAAREEGGTLNVVLTGPLEEWAQ